MWYNNVLDADQCGGLTSGVRVLGLATYYNMLTLQDLALSKFIKRGTTATWGTEAFIDVIKGVERYSTPSNRGLRDAVVSVASPNKHVLAKSTESTDGLAVKDKMQKFTVDMCKQMSVLLEESEKTRTGLRKASEEQTKTVNRLEAENLALKRNTSRYL